jgi:CheY-like chemotaxis protein
VIQILLVADDPGFRDRLRLALERLELTGEEVSFLEAANGNDALVLAESQLPDLVVADVSVTPYGGFGLTRDLKANPETACPVILILDRFQDEWLGRWSGADALVNRPVDPFALAQVASQLLEEDDEENQEEQGEATLEGAAP